MLKTYDSTAAAYTEQNTPKYYDKTAAAWTEAPSAKTYDTATTSWVEQLKKAVRFWWAYSTGTNEAAYEYQPNGASAFVRAIVTSDQSRTDVALKIGALTLTASAYLVEVNVSSAVGDSTSSAVAFGYINKNGEAVHVSTTPYSDITAHQKASASINPAEDISGLYICIQNYGATSSYCECVLSNLTVNGVAYDFK